MATETRRDPRRRAQRPPEEDDRFIRGKGNYVDDMQAPRDAAHGDPAQPVRPREDQRDRHGGGRGGAGRGRRRHRRADGSAQPGVDAHAVRTTRRPCSATDKVRFQGQEVAAVIATDPYIAKDALELIEVDYDPLEPIVTPQRALEADAPVIRDDKEGQTDNHIYHWEAGDKEATDAAFARRGQGRLAGHVLSRAATRRRSRRAAAWPTWTRPPGRPRST